MSAIFVEKGTIQDRNQVQTLWKMIYFRMVIKADLYKEEYSLNNKYYAYKWEYGPEIISFTYCKKEYYLR